MDHIRHTEQPRPDTEGGVDSLPQLDDLRPHLVIIASHEPAFHVPFF